MDSITITRYDNPQAVGYQGWIEPKNKSWVLFIDLAGKPLLFPHRAEDGRVLNRDGLGPHTIPPDDVRVAVSGPPVT